jgi:UDP-N-acetylglucosamine 2-epimerase (non-hydrolysing)
MKPLGFFDFVRLEIEAACVLSDSGTVQEECCIFGVPNVTLRDVTERAETIECGSNILTGGDAAAIERGVSIALAKAQWTPPAEYLVPNVSQTVAKIVLGYAI